jgi:outer membrane protein assembly factor BamB
VYTLGSEGHLFCLDAADGRVLWSKHLGTAYDRPDSPVWGYASNPLLDSERLIVFVGGVGQTVVALHKDTGAEIWRAVDSRGEHGPGYSSPTIIESGGVRQLIVWHPRAVSSIDPVSGRVFWEQPFALQNGLCVATPRHDGNQLFLSAFYNGSLMLNLDPTKPAASVAWQRHGPNEKITDALHCLISTPVIDGDHIYGVCSHGELRCLDRATGDRKWETFAATSGQSARWGTAFIVKQGDRYVLFNEQGDLILARLTPVGYHEVGRAHLVDPTGPAQRREVVWVHPAFANRNVYVRNDKEIVSVSLAKE